MQQAQTPYAQRKGRLQLSISQEILDRIEPLREEINFSAEVELLLNV